MGSVECRRCFEGVLSSDTILEDCIMNRQSFSFFRQGFRPFTGSTDNVESTSLLLWVRVRVRVRVRVS